MLRVVTANLNGIRSASVKGFLSWLSHQNADVVCLQELKAQLPDLTPEMSNPGDFKGYFHCAAKKGYSGVGIYTRRTPDRLIEGIGIEEFDLEGRFLQADFGNLSIVSLYLPSGSSSEERQAAKFRFMAHFQLRMAELRASGRDVIVCGDWNIAHQEIDLKNWRSNQKNSGFLPEERRWLSGLFDDQGWVDTYRQIHPEATDACYTWWSNRGQAWAKNVGWRLDYQLATPELAARAVHAAVYKEQRFSDHAPLSIHYDLALGN